MAAVREYANAWKKIIRDIFQKKIWTVSMTVIGGAVGGPLGALVGTIFVITPHTLGFVLIFNTRAIVDYIIPDDDQRIVEDLKNLSDVFKRQLVEALKEPLVEALKNLSDVEKRQLVEAFKKPLLEALKEPLV